MTTQQDREEMQNLLTMAFFYLAPGDWHYQSGWVWGKSLKGGDNHVADIRGWGYLTGGGCGALGMSAEKAEVAQKAWGDLICAAVNALPALLAENERLREGLEEIATADSWTTGIGALQDIARSALSTGER